jgi:hypothetical protein
MRKLLLRLWSDECGALIGTEWVFVVTIMVLGCGASMVLTRGDVLNELADFSQTVEVLGLGYSYGAQGNGTSSTGGSALSNYATADRSDDAIAPFDGDSDDPPDTSD